MSTKPQSSPQKQNCPNSTPEVVSRKSFQNFSIGFILTGIPVGILLATSVYMTHSPLAQVGVWSLGGAIALPVMAGFLTTRYPQAVLNSLEKVLEVLPL